MTIRHAMFGKEAIEEFVLTEYYELEIDKNEFVVPMIYTYDIHETSAFSPEYFLYLYNKVGEPWGWWMFNQLTREKLVKYLTAENKSFHVLGNPTNPKGFCIMSHETPRDNICYFGIFPEYVGQGLGKNFLRYCIEYCFHHKANKVWLYTTSRDHPSALHFYQSVGMKIINHERKTEWLPIDCVK